MIDASDLLVDIPHNWVVLPRIEMNGVVYKSRPQSESEENCSGCAFVTCHAKCMESTKQSPCIHYHAVHSVECFVWEEVNGKVSPKVA